MLLASFYFSLASYQCVKFNMILKTKKNRPEWSCLWEGTGLEKNTGCKTGSNTGNNSRVTNERISKFTFFYLIPRGYELFYHFRVANDPPCPSQQSTNQNFLFHATAESSLLISGFFAGFWIWNSKTFEQFRRKKYIKYSPKARVFYQPIEIFQ